MVAYATVMVFGWVLGVPAAYGLIMYKSRSQLRKLVTAEVQTHASRALLGGKDENARKLAAEDMDQLFKDAQTDRIVVRDEQREMWSDSKWEVMHESDRAKRWLVDGLTRTAMVRMAKSAEKRTVPDARAAVRVGIELHEFAEEYAHLPTLLNTLNESLRGFLNRPLFLNEKDTMFNFLILGQAGVGKTRLGTKMCELLSHFGLYLYDKMKVASRSDFVADFEGQTANKVRGFLAANQERVLFLDEAYALSTYEPMKPGQEKKDRKLTVYSQEAIDALNQYLSENAGSGCFIAAGYPKEMEEDFLPANKGLIRRFETTVEACVGGDEGSRAPRTCVPYAFEVTVPGASAFDAAAEKRCAKSSALRTGASSL